MADYSKYNAKRVLEQVENCIEYIDLQQRKRYRTREICNDLSIFDWWVDYMSKSKLEDMRKFLKTAIKLGYTGYVCFKVGAAGCANGMWAHKAESENGYSPDGEFLYKSFTPSYNYWSVKAGDGNIYPERDEYDKCKTIKQLEEMCEWLGANLEW